MEIFGKRSKNVQLSLFQAAEICATLCVFAEYEYLWTTEKNNWVLVKSSYGYGIINKTTRAMLTASDDELEKALIERMLAEGCKTYDNIKAAYADAQ